jgi:hypothetical protein
MDLPIRLSIFLFFKEIRCRPVLIFYGYCSVCVCSLFMIWTGLSQRPRKSIAEDSGDSKRRGGTSLPIIHIPWYIFSVLRRRAGTNCPV